MKKQWQYYGATLAVVLAFVVVIMGAYTRLTHAGLGCPDWPGCYGHMVVPPQHSVSGTAIQEVKAWTEMVHRYAAGSLGLLILLLAVMSLVMPSKHRLLPLFLLGLVIFQAALGMWTVTLKLLPLVVMGHLLGGISIFACLWWLRLSAKPQSQNLVAPQLQSMRPWAMLGLAIVFAQIALGGWVSSNYAGLACIGFPSCNGILWPHMNFSQAFNVLQPIGVNYQGGVLTSVARITIQMVHRIGAVVTVIYVASLAVAVLRRKANRDYSQLAWLMLVLLAIQFSLGVINVTKLLPLPIAVAHNGVAALLLVSLVTLNYYLSVGSQSQDVIK